MRKVKHPKELYIQISDQDDNLFGLSFTDGKSVGGDSTIDANAFDSETRQRALLLLKTAYTYIYDRLKPVEG